MKYMLICLAALLICFGLGFLLSKLLKKIIKKLNFRFSTVIMTILSGIVIMAAAGLIYLSIYYPADDAAKAALQGSETVAVSHIEHGYFFDGPESTTALIFYPGAKVEASAYAPLMLKLAEKGTDCFLTEMPFNMAFFGSGYADGFIAEYDYENWYISGHSMGGMTAANYAAAHSDSIDGLILLAAYSTKSISDGIVCLSIYGSNDGCLSMGPYEAGRKKLPAESIELVIDGGNHAQFGNYGMQKGDGIASISADKQQEITVNAICELKNQSY